MILSRSEYSDHMLCFNILILTLGSFFGGLLFGGSRLSLMPGCDTWTQVLIELISIKHKLLPRGIPDLIHAKPHLYGSKDFKVVLDTYYSVQEFLIDAKGCCDTWAFRWEEQEWAPPDDPVFRLVPPTFAEQATALYTAMGQPAVSSLTFWVVYVDLLAAFRLFHLIPRWRRPY